MLFHVLIVDFFNFFTKPFSFELFTMRSFFFRLDHVQRVLHASFIKFFLSLGNFVGVDTEDDVSKAVILTEFFVEKVSCLVLK